jgi:hypothetical protein
MAYLARVLADDSDSVATLVDGLVDDAENYVQQGVESGILQPSDNPRARAVLLTIWGLGALALHEHVDRLLGVDLTDPDILGDASFASYAAPIYEVYGKGLFTPEFSEHSRAALAEMAAPDQTTITRQAQTEGNA